MARFETGTLVAAIDGLGHGNEAASAARFAASILEQDPGKSLKGATGCLPGWTEVIERPRESKLLPAIL